MSDQRNPLRSGSTPARATKTVGVSRAAAGKKTAKADRKGRICPACGGVQPGLRQRVKATKATGTRIRRAARVAEQATNADPARVDVPSAEPVDSPAAPAPRHDLVDAPTLISGIVDGIHSLLGASSTPDQAPPAQVAAAVRKAVLDEFRQRALFVGRIAEIDALLWSSPDRGGLAVRSAMAEHFAALGVRRIEEPGEAQAFVVTEGEGELLELLRPAYVDERTGKVILAGQLRRVRANAGVDLAGGEA